MPTNGEIDWNAGAVKLIGTADDIKLQGGSLSITGDGSNAVTLTESGNGDFTIDAPDDIRLDAGGGDIVLKSAGTEYGRISKLSSDLSITSSATNSDILINPNGNGNVGIGTTSPVQKFHVHGGNINIQNGDGAYLTFNNGDANIVANYNGSGRDLSFKTYNGTALAEKMRIDKDGALKLNTYTAGTLVSDASGNITVSSGGGAGGPYLPLAGGTMTGTNGVLMPDNFRLKIGTSEDLLIFHDGTDSQIFNQAGDLKIRNDQNDGDIVFMSDNGSGGVENYIQIDGSEGRTLFNKNTRLNDNVKAQFGGSGDFNIFHNGLNSYIENDTGDLYIRSNFQDRDIILQSDNGGGGIATYIQIDGSKGSVELNHYGAKKFETTAGGTINTGTIDSTGTITVTGANGNVGINTDTGKLLLGASYDLQIYHDGSNSYIKDAGTGSIIVNGDFFRILNSAGNSQMFRCDANDSVQLYYNNSVKLVTTNTGVTVTGAATATTFLGDLNGTINTATTAVTKANATNDTTVATTAFVQNLIGTIPAGLVFQGTWNASTNTPTLTSGSGTTGHFYIVSTDGSTNLDGITDWKVGDWAVFVEQGATDAWEKVDNSSVLDGTGTGQKVTMWSGSGTSNTLTNAPITVSGDNATFTGDVSLADSKKLILGAGSDLQIYHNNSNDRGYIYNATGDLYIENDATNGDIKFYSDDGSGGTTEYFRLDGGSTMNVFSKPTWHGDGVKSFFGNSQDLQIYHDGSHSRIADVGTGHLVINATDFVVNNSADTKNMIIATDGGSVNLYYNALQKFRTISAGVEVTGNIDLPSNGAILFDNTNNTEQYYIRNGGGSQSSFQVGKGSPGSDIKLVIDDGGNVGIGTTAPGEKLVIAGGVLAYGDTSSIGSGTSYYLGNNPNSRDIVFTRVANAELGIGRYNGGWYETMRFDIRI
jgi:hypothetical protein